MKKIYFLLLLFTYSCTDSSQMETKELLISEEKFITMLEEIHMFEAGYHLERISDLKSAENNLIINYKDLFKKHNVSSSDFEKCMKYYSSNPEKLSQIYSEILENLKNKYSLID